MKRNKVRSWRHAAALAVPMLISACAANPITGRNELMLLSEDQEKQMGLQAYRNVLQQETVSRDPQANAVVERVGRRIAQAAGRGDYQWEFTVVDKPEVNAFVLPGGKVVVYTGLLRIAGTDDELAAVIGHEVGHAIARHGGERVSRDMLTQMGVSAVSGALAGGDPAMTQQVAGLLGAGATVGLSLPFSRSQESEADYMGLALMTKAGYNPAAAVTLWQKMARASQGKAPPEFLSTHPADETRIRQIEQWLPEIRAKYGAGR